MENKDILYRESVMTKNQFLREMDNHCYKRISSPRAYEKLLEGSEVMYCMDEIKIHTGKGCPSCNRRLTTPYCPQCGSKTTDTVETVELVNRHWTILWSTCVDTEDGEHMVLHQDKCHPLSPGRTFHECLMTLQDFMKINHWYSRTS